MQALADFDGDGYIYLEDLQQAGEECFEVAAEMEAGPRSTLAKALTGVSALLHGRKVRRAKGGSCRSAARLCISFAPDGR